MKTAGICFTEYGVEVLKKLSSGLDGIDCYYKIRDHIDIPELTLVQCTIQDWAGEQFKKHAALIFIGAAGIAVRAIAPFVNNKLLDSPVIVVDDAGKFVIPILSGHVGGANELALRIADILKATPVITTSTDVHGAFAADIYAKENNLEIINKAGIAPVSAKALRGEEIDMDADIRIISGPVTEEMRQAEKPLYLRKKEYTVGIGCKKGKSREEIKSLLEKVLLEAGLEAGQLLSIASADLKKDEPGLKELADELRIPFVTFSAEELNRLEGDFTESEFVLKVTGAGNICERAAVAACGGKGELIIKKQGEDGVTCAIAKIS